MNSWSGLVRSLDIDRNTTTIMNLALVLNINSSQILIFIFWWFCLTYTFLLHMFLCVRDARSFYLYMIIYHWINKSYHILFDLTMIFIDQTIKTNLYYMIQDMSYFNEHFHISWVTYTSMSKGLSSFSIQVGDTIIWNRLFFSYSFLSYLHLHSSILFFWVKDKVFQFWFAILIKTANHQ
jgi:hypothetical protein